MTEVTPDDLWDLSPGVQQQWVDVAKDNIEYVSEDGGQALEETGRWER